MNNGLIKVNKNIKGKLIHNNKIKASKSFKNGFTNNKKNKSNNKIKINKKNKIILNQNKILKNNVSTDIYTLKKSNSNKIYQKGKNNKISSQNKNKKNSNNNKKFIKSNKHFIFNKSSDKIKFKKNSIKSELLNKKENNYKPINTPINNNKIMSEMENFERKDTFTTMHDKINLEKETKIRKDKRCKTINSNNPIDIKRYIIDIEKQFNNINQTNEIILKELDIINKNNIILNQNELKINDIINNPEKEDKLLKNQLLQNYLNKEKMQNKYFCNNISIINEKINKLKEIKNDIDNYNKKISDFISMYKNGNFTFNNNISLLLEIKNVSFNLKNSIQKYLQLSKEIQNSQKIITNNLIYEISYLKNSIIYLKNTDRVELINNNNFIKDLNNENNKNNKSNNNLINKIKNNDNNISNNNENKNKNIENKIEDNFENYNKLRENLLFNLDKEKLKKIALLAPTKENSQLSDLINYFKNNTNNLNMFERAYVVFYWMSENIIYDKKTFETGKNFDSTPEGIYKYGKSICSGYSKLFSYITTNLGIETECISGYAKGYEYNPGEKMEKPNHEWNAIKINDNYFLIDSTWGSGYEEGYTHTKELDDFYFCCNPKYLIFSHFPEEEKWQLLNQKITKEEFFEQVQIHSCFFTYHLTDINFKKTHFDVKNIESIKILYDTKNTKDIIDVCVDIYFQNTNNNYIKEENCDYIIKNEKDFEIKLIFNKIGNYKVCLYGKNQNMDEYESMIEYFPESKQNLISELHFPKFFSESSDIQIIQPLYDNLKLGQEIKFIVKSNVLDEIIIKGEHWYHVKKNNNGYFEENIKIGKNCIIGKKNLKGQCLSLVKYNI